MVRHDDELGIDYVGNSGGDPYNGDTLITKTLPVLAIKKENLPRPPYAIIPSGGGMPDEYYRGWTGGTIALTPPIQGIKLVSLEAANAYVAETLGPDYQMAEFHDGKWVTGMDKNTFFGPTWPDQTETLSGGWGFHAYGNIGDSSRFWVYINDQAANPWD